MTARRRSLWAAHSRRLSVLNRLHGQIMGHVVRIYGKGEPELEEFLRDLATQVHGRIAFENSTRPEMDV